MVSITITFDEEDGDLQTTLTQNGLLVGWRNLLREEQLGLLRGLSQNFFKGQNNLNEP